MAVEAAAQQPTSKATLDVSETVFSTLASIGHCGYGGTTGDELRRAVLQDVANAVAFLCSDLASYVTGVGLNVSGGIELFTF